MTSVSSSRGFMPRSVSARLAKEVAELSDASPDFRLVVDQDTGMPANLQELMAELEGPADTPYAGKYFLLRFTFGSDFPATPPTAHFLTKVYHPNVDPTTGAICVNTLKRDWKPDHTLKHVLSVIRCLLIVPFPESSLNEDAGKLFMESYDEYFKRAVLHADVHGRTVSVAAAAAAKQPPATADNASCDAARGVLQNASDNSSSCCSSTAANAGGKTKKKKMVKKKSLKRL